MFFCVQQTISSDRCDVRLEIMSIGSADTLQISLEQLLIMSLY